MLKKLKRSFVLDSMIMTFIVLLVGVFVLFVVTESYYKTRTLDAMKAATNSVSIKETEDGNLDVDFLQSGFASMYTGNIIVVITDTDGNIGFASSSVKLDDATIITRAVRYVVNANQSQGSIPNYSMRFLKTQKGEYNCIALADLTEEKGNIYFQLIMYVLAALMAFGMLYIMAEYMSERSITPIKQSMEDQSRFVADASHELKTPLTVILANMDIMLANPDMAPEEQRKWLESTKEEAKMMTGLVTDMLSLSRTEGKEAQKIMAYESVNFSDLVDDAILSAESLAYERKIALKSEIQSNLTVVADSGKMRQVVMILVDNALKYTKPGGNIFVTLKNAEKNVVLTVYDDGEPIPEDRRQNIFDRFFRVEDSRQKDGQTPGGYGLGLPIAKNITDAHNGRLYLDYSDETGTCFVVTLPSEENHKAPKLSKNSGGVSSLRKKRQHRNAEQDSGAEEYSSAEKCNGAEDENGSD